MPAIDKDLIIQKIVANDGLPSPSPIIMQLLTMAADEKASVADLAQIIEQDAGLTIRLLRLVNTAFYARNTAIASIGQAILTIGIQKLRSLALCISLRDSFPLGQAGGMDYDYFWKTSLYRALIAQGFAQSSSQWEKKHDEGLFTAGLILEIGTLLLFNCCPEPLHSFFPGAGGLLEDHLAWEEEHLGINHRTAGSIVLKHWHFPEQIIANQQYYGLQALDQDRSHYCKMLEFARSCTQIFFDQRSDFGFIQEMAPRVGLEFDQVNEILCTTFAQVEEIAAQLRLKVHSDKDQLQILQKANEALARINGSLELRLGNTMDLLSSQEQYVAPVVPDQVQERKKTLENILDAVAHEIRNPLMAIGGFAQRLTRNAEGSADLLKYANIIAEESSRLEEVLNKTLAFSRSYQPALTTSNLISILDRSVADLQNSTSQRHIEIIKNYHPDPYWLPLDEEAIKNAVQQLLETMAQLLKDGHSKIWVALPQPQLNDLAKIAIYTKGITVPEDIRNMLLGLDFSSGAQAVDLGLLLTWKIIHAHNGRIDLTEVDDVNSIVIYLPVPSA